MAIKKTLKKIIPDRVRSSLLSALSNVQIAAAKLASRSSLGSSLYYAVVSSEFSRENQSVLLGKLHYWESLGSDLDSYTLLRRNAHRIEKGLIMRPRREVFAEAFIGETVECFAVASKNPTVCVEEIGWVRDVLEHYFAVVEPTPLIRSAQLRFLEALSGTREEPHRIPYEHRTLPDISVQFESLETLFLRRRSVRWFKEELVPMRDLENAIRIAALAPSACNRQPFEFHVTTGEKAQKIASLAGGAAGFLHNIPCIVAVVGNLAAYPFEKDRHLIYIDGSLASMQLMLALETLGVSTCSINWPDLSSAESRARALLGTKMHHHIVMLIAVGYARADGGVPYSQKKKPTHIMKVH